MDVIDSIPKLCQRLISFAFQRCRLSEDLCRISVALRCSSADNPAAIQISISDTGISSSLEEFQDLNFTDEGYLAESWDRTLAMRSTGISDEEVHNYELNLKEVTSTFMLYKLPSIPKNGVKFSGTEVCFTVCEKLDILLDDIKRFFLKKIAFEVLVHHEDDPGLHCKNAFIPNECNLPFAASSLERLKSGFEDYVLKNLHNLYGNENLCSTTSENLKAGVGTTYSSECSRHAGLLMEAVVIVSEISDQTNTSPMECDSQTEVLYFRDFSPSPISKSFLTPLLSIDWKNYGLILGDVVEQGGRSFINWENLPPYVHIDVVFHCYQEKISYPSVTKKAVSIRSLLKKATKLALEDMKEKHKGILLSDHAVKIRAYAPDLARTLAGLIESSHDLQFQGECLSLLGLQFEKVGAETVEECIRDKIISVIELNDRRPERCKEAAPFLFEHDGAQEPNLEEEYEERIHACDSFDL